MMKIYKNTLKLGITFLVLGILLAGGASATTVLGTTKITFADTILAKVVSDIYGYPIVLFDKNILTNDTLQELQDLNATEVIIIGGPAVISPEVEQQLKNLGYNVTRIWGVTRYETSALVAKLFWDFSDEAIIVTSDLVNERAKIWDIKRVREAVEEAIDESAPLLITPTGTLEENVVDALVSLGVKKVKIFTKAANLRNITSQLLDLNITFEIEREIDIKREINCTKTIKIAVPENVNWTFARELLVGFRCLEITPVPLNTTLSELQQNFDYVVLNQEGMRRIKRIIREEFKEKVRFARGNVTEVLGKRVEKLLYELRKEIARLEAYYNETNDPRILDLILELKDKEGDIVRELKKGKMRDALEEAMEAMEELKETKWKMRIYQRELKLREIRRIREMSKEKYLETLKELYDLEDEDLRELRYIPDPYRIKIIAKEKLREKYRQMRNKTYCIQVITPACDPYTGVCKEFPTPCDVPEGWRIIRDPEEYREMLKKMRERMVVAKPIFIEGGMEHMEEEE